MADILENAEADLTPQMCNLIPIMVSNDRPTCKDRHAAELIMARRDIST
jgi:hypothetical protein